MGKVIQFPAPQPQSKDSLDLPLPHGGVPEQCLATFRMLTKDIEAGKRVPECFFLMYGSHRGNKPDTMSWSYLALSMSPAELARAVKRVVKDLSKRPNPEGRSRPSSRDEEPPDCA